MSRRMTDEEWQAFLMEGTRTAKVGTVLRDGRPHVTPVWFVLDDGDLVFTTPGDSVKARSLRRDPRVCVCVDLEEQPFGFVMLEGEAVLVDDRDAVEEWTARIRARYAPAASVASTAPAKADAYNRPPGLLVRVKPSRVIAVSYDDE
ncbi:pyridoxamine 5-phosphate oxidase [Carbonactinospora thermoautotrophica]|uniref:Putative F420-dependent enzyme n=1 Tax=Carbonactinospora thermoautotrophica TaxID=1469144 RepID=A0A132N6A1_9ACTN|nr:PPOX class F420-dependent oxidoreductase [Carbonactinospora thermoautotrophica]KWX01418.1 putative F420-dependent enzyme [Carbonactinospora thermoautotrophica]KWX05658.1 pyridoxamine 5-phosphate oxidase [Carbonactinospora thermoautotrophica]KWX07287.1 pyridoxamine 5-phosphate oxidase [Carbonactinospora thermoautotrophica]